MQLLIGFEPREALVLSEGLGLLHGIFQTKNNPMEEAKCYAVFEAIFPDDSQEEDGEIVVPAGRSIMEALCERLLLAGHKVAPPAQRSFYGWFSEFLIGKITIWLLLQQPGPWLLIVEARAGWLTRAETKSHAVTKGIEEINQALKQEGRITALRWMTKREFEELKRGDSKPG